ncbi:hypothetical protein ACFY3J_04900 [Streptomyces sp. NPDC001231]|uniref:hypothetical protein n=1 Tax=unclassified Streptomyces TaxID=2593676 RepID=UPI0036B8EC49
MSERGRRKLPQCRGRHPHLGTYEPNGYDRDPVLMVAGASNQWFPLTLSALALPKGQGGDIDTESASRRNIEAGVLVSGGEAPRRAAEHVVELQRLGVLQPMDAVGRKSASRRP